MTTATEERFIPSAGTRLHVDLLFRHWERFALTGILALASFLDFFRLGQRGFANLYYAAAVRSMLQNWHNFFFVSFDPGGFVTVDKPPLGFWIQTASAKLFGFHGWSILAPQALAGVLSVLLLFRLVRRTFGPAAGLIAAAAMAVTPVAVADNRDNTIDSLLVLALLLATLAVLRASESGRLRWLLLGMALVGLGFNIKMLQAYLALPALVALYAVAAPRRWPVRVAHLAVGGIVLAVVSLSWAAAVDLTPASQRPYVGSSQHNSEIELALQYNGVQRLLGMGVPRAGSAGQPATRTPSPAETAPAGQATGAPAANGSASGGLAMPADGPAAGGFRPPAGGAPAFVQGSAGPLRLFDKQLGGNASWLLPIGLFGAVAVLAGAFMHRRQPFGWRSLLSRPDPATQQVTLWGMWALTVGAFFSVAGFFHPYYLIMLAPAASALAGIAITALWTAAHRPGWLGWLLPVALVVTAATQVYMLAPYPAWNDRLSPLIAGLAGVATITAIFALIRAGSRISHAVLVGSVILGLAGMFIAPATWSGITTAQGDSGPLPAGGPAGSAGFELPPGIAGGPTVGGSQPGIGGPGGGPLGGPGLNNGDASLAQLIPYLQANRDGARFLLAVPSSMEAAPIIIQSGEPVMALGGFSGGDPILSEQQVAADVADKTVRFFLLSSPSVRDGAQVGAPTAAQGQPSLPAPPSGASSDAVGFQPSAGMPAPFGANSAAQTWVTSHCSAVPLSVWQAAATAAPGSGLGFGPAGGRQLYDCASPSA
jgi:4-amino-4-deoxy-L-arabinose transferase-like glycosyltransferase